MTDSNSQCVTSKYFASNIAMDESLSDFKESKRNCKGPKTDQKLFKVKKIIKPKIVQKGITTALKKNKNDLITYTKEFDNVCKKSGLDVDSEQLQLAVALSKSLQNESSGVSTSKSFNKQGRIAKIRTTLREYGFRIPEKTINANKKFKKHKTLSQLITTTNEERCQKITSKYSQILFECLAPIKSYSVFEESKTPIFNIATNLSYKLMKDNKIFYVDNLIEKTTTSGSMLKDWTTIPGRPVSPVLVHIDKSLMDFTKITCSQDDLDVILSGSIRAAEDIVTKYVVNAKECADFEKPDVLKNELHNCLQHNGEHHVIEEGIHVGKDENILGSEDCGQPANNSVATEQFRCCSPDIFDDEVSCIMEISKPLLSQEQHTKIFTDEMNYMDLTECTSKEYQNIEKPQSQNITKRKSGDFMEMTQCAVSASQGIKDVKYIKDNVIDLTQSLVKEIDRFDSECCYNSVIVITEHNKSETVNCLGVKNTNTYSNENNLSQKSFKEATNSIILEEYRKEVNYVNSKKEIEIPDRLVKTQPFKDNIDLTQSSNEEPKDLTITEDLEQSSKRCLSIDIIYPQENIFNIDDLPKIPLDISEVADLHKNTDDTIILEEEEYISSNSNTIKSVIVPINVVNNQVYDLTQAADDSAQEKSDQYNHSFYDDFVYNHSDSKENAHEPEVYLDNLRITSDERNSIDLTQSSNDSSRNSTIELLTHENIPKNSSLGKSDDGTSIVYDDVCGNVTVIQGSENREKNLSVQKSDLILKCDSLNSQILHDGNKVECHNDLLSNLSQNSEVLSQKSEIFDLTDSELNYSLHKSTYYDPIEDYNIDCGGSSEKDGLLNCKKSLDDENSVIYRNVTHRQSFVPKSDIEKHTVTATGSGGSNINRINGSSPFNDQSNGIIPIVTPNNSEYIIKTNEVTPMADYAGMTTPQRNKELHKYGLRPFKRKRAIQILTHIYNQTHPMLESNSDDEISSPAKKTRQENETTCVLNEAQNPSKEAQEETVKKSPVKLRNTIENIKSPRKNVRKSKSPRQDIENSRNTKSPSNKSGCSRNEISPRKRVNNDNIISVYEITSEVPVIRSVECNPDDWVFQKKEKAKVYSCRLPLHIAFHNYVSSRRGLREAILKYEPINIDLIHKDLVSYGHRYDPKDLLRFLDKKCITVKTADNNARNKR